AASHGVADEAEAREELHRRHVELLERLAALQEEAAGIKRAPPDDQPRLEQEIMERFREASRELEDLSQEQLSQDAADLRSRLRRHRISWPAQTALDMEDHLSRAHDIFVFWFFEARDRVDNSLKDFEPTSGFMDQIPEYPADWASWRVDSARLREQAAWNRRKSGTHGPRLSDSPESLTVTPEREAVADDDPAMN
ncbi:unnamed protein product, partial [Polarella glacialis]